MVLFGESVLTAAPLGLKAMLDCRLSIAEIVPPLQLTLPTPEKILVPLTMPDAISKITAPPSTLVPLLNVTVAPFTRLVPEPVNV